MLGIARAAPALLFDSLAAQLSALERHLTIMSTTTGATFEALAKTFFAGHPDVPHEWRTVRSRWFGDRTDLVCGVGLPDEVFATVRADTIAIGTSDGHEDFGNRGEKEDEVTVAHAAFQYFLSLLRTAGYLDAAL